MKWKYRTNWIRLIALILIISLLCPAVCSGSIAANGRDNTDGSIGYGSDYFTGTEITPLTESVEDEPVQLDAVDIPHFVSEQQIEDHGHILRLSEEETINSVIYLNEDGSKTAYIMDYPVKYTDENGDIQFTNLSLMEEPDYYRTTASSMTLRMSKDYSDGVSLSYGGFSVSLTAWMDSVSSENINTAPMVTTVATSEYVTYEDIFGEGVDARYTPTYNGIKEDIILAAYSGDSSFRFLLSTGGMYVFETEGQFYIAASADSESRMDIGEVIAYDANGILHEGELTVTPVKPGQIYQIEVSVDSAFLTDEDTAYPVTIDPSLTFSDTTHGSGSVIDAPVYTANPSKNYGAYKYNRAGYAGESYGVGRTAVQFSGLGEDDIFEILTVDAINSAIFYVRDASGGTARTVNVYPLTTTNTWTESSITWNDTVGNISSTLVASGSLGNNAWTGFDITSLVEGWITGTYIMNRGFIMMGADETVNASFHSSEASSSTNWPYLVVNYRDSGVGGGDSFEDAVELALDDNKYLYTVLFLEQRYFSFTPEVSGEYLIFSYSAESTSDPLGSLYDSDLILLAEDDDGAKNKNFRLVANLTQGETYYIEAGHYDKNFGSYRIQLWMKPDIPEDVYHLRNTSTSHYVDIHGPNEQISIHQWTYSAGLQSRWEIVQQSDGYYTIQSLYGNEYYIGVSSTSTGVDNIQLFTSVSNSTRWKLYCKTTGELMLEPKTAPGRVLCAPNSMAGTELQLVEMSSTASRNKWKIEFQSPTTLEGQQMSNWCWATSARMLANHYQTVPDLRSQEQAVDVVKDHPTDPNEGGSPIEAIMAVNYYVSGDMFSNSLGLVIKQSARYSESTLCDILNDGHVVLCGRIPQVTGNNMGHMTLIGGYTTVYVNGEMEYRIFLYDPWPEGVSQGWAGQMVTQGQLHTCTYQWLCDGTTGIDSDPDNNAYTWVDCVVVNSTYTGATIPVSEN